MRGGLINEKRHKAVTAYSSHHMKAPGTGGAGTLTAGAKIKRIRDIGNFRER